MFGGSGSTGPAPDGEVEDYEVLIGKRTPVTIQVNRTTSPVSVDLSWNPVAGASSFDAFSTTDLTTGPVPTWTQTTGVSSVYNIGGPLLAEEFFNIIAWPSP
jgi:hypothetical protein